MEAAQMMFPPWQAPVEKVKPPPSVGDVVLCVL